MGMDVYGVENKKAYFRANIWSWTAIHDLIRKLGSDLVDKETLVNMGSNSGAGITSPKDCVTLANRLDMWMEHNANGSEITPQAGDMVFFMGEAIRSSIASLMVNLKSEAEAKGEDFNESEVSVGNNAFTYRVEDDHLKEFITFLRECGGFEVH